MDYDLNRMMDRMMRMVQERHDLQMEQAKHPEYYADLASKRKKDEDANKGFLDRLMQADRNETDLEKQRIADNGAIARQTLVNRGDADVANIKSAESRYGVDQGRESALELAKIAADTSKHNAGENYKSALYKASSESRDKNLDAFGKALGGLSDMLTPDQRKIETDRLKGVFNVGPVIPSDTVGKEGAVAPAAPVAPVVPAAPVAPTPAAPVAPVAPAPAPVAPVAPAAPPQQIMAPIPKKKNDEMNPGAQKASAMLGDFYSRFKMPPPGNLYIPVKKQQY